MDKYLENKNWKNFKLGDIFTIENCKCSRVSGLEEGTFPYVGATNRNNGVINFVKPIENLITRGNCVAFICDGEGSIGLSIYRKSDFIGSTTVKVGRNKYLNEYNGQFITTIADKVRSKYNFGFKRNKGHLEEEILVLPTDSLGNPDFVFMESYMRQKEQEKLNKYKVFISRRLSELKKYTEVDELYNKEWEEFEIEDIAEIVSGRDIYEKERVKGNTPYISATANNNGIGYFVGNSNNTLESGCLSVNRNGSVGYSFYHPYNALFSNDCRKLRLKYPSKYVGIFISQEITKQRGKYGYGYKMGTARLKRQKIMLPINKQGEPDYIYMENYMKKIEYQKLSKYFVKKYKKD